MRALIACLLLLVPVLAAAAPSTRLPHAVWLGPGCDRLVDTDDLHGMTGRAIAEAGTAPRESGDRLEIECFGQLLAEKPRPRAYVSLRVTITRLVPYRGQQGRLLLNRETQGVTLDAASGPALRETLRRAIAATLREPLAAYAGRRYGEVVAEKYPWPERIGQVCRGP